MRFYDLPRPVRPIRSEKNFASAIEFIRLGDVIRTLVGCGREVPPSMFRHLNEEEDRLV